VPKSYSCSVEGASRNQDERFADWYVWAKREVSTDSRVCLGVAQAAMEALDGGADEHAARLAARRSLAGHGIALLSRIAPRRRAYAEWFDWARREIGGRADRHHVAARAALDHLDQGGDAAGATTAAREALARTPVPAPEAPATGSWPSMPVPGSARPGEPVAPQPPVGESPPRSPAPAPVPVAPPIPPEAVVPVRPPERLPDQAPPSQVGQPAAWSPPGRPASPAGEPPTSPAEQPPAPPAAWAPPTAPPPPVQPPGQPAAWAPPGSQPPPPPAAPAPGQPAAWAPPGGQPPPPPVAPPPAAPAGQPPAAAWASPGAPAATAPLPYQYQAYPGYVAPPPPTAPTHAYAGFWRRVAAWMIDSLLLTVGLVIVVVVVSVFAAIGLASSGQTITDQNAGGVQLALYVVLLVLSWLYYAGLESSAWQGTVGKRIMRLLVTDAYGRRIGFGRATGRYFGKILSALVLFVGYLMVPFTEQKQGLHDLMAGTLVVRQQYLSLLTAPPPPPATAPARAGSPSEVQGA
jgi:uncharacterized RDD family membrane protein YckC